jgi:hypothetical protein
MKNVVLVSLPRFDLVYLSGALAILAAIAKENDYGVAIYDYNVDLNKSLSRAEWDELDLWLLQVADSISPELENKIKSKFVSDIAKLINMDTKYLCFSVFSFCSHNITTKVLQWCKEHFPQVKTIIGGGGVSATSNTKNPIVYGEFVKQQKLANYVVFGEGEMTFEKLLKGIGLYPGINQNNPIQLSSLDDLPVPTYEHFDVSKYNDPRILLTGSRGCVRHCTFCEIDLVWPKYQYRSAEKLVEEITTNFYKYGISKFEFTDSLINGSITNFVRFNELLYEAKQKDSALQGITYKGQFICRDPSATSDRMYELMHLAGCNMITVGIESFSNSVRTHMKKKFSDRAIEYHLEQCGKWAIPNTLLMIAGYVTETLDDHQANLDALRKYQIYSQMGVIYMIRWGFTLHLLQDTPLFKNAADVGIVINSTHGHNVMDTIFDWTTTKDPSNTFAERCRRRLELHELSYELGYSMPRVKDELNVLLSVAQKLTDKSV